MRIAIIIIILLMPVTGYSQNPVPPSPSIKEFCIACSDDKVQKKCPATCAKACAKSRDFKNNNWEYCQNVLPPNIPQDATECPAMVRYVLNNPPSPKDKCAHITDLFEKIKCEQQATKSPKCAPNVWTLVENAEKLANSIDRALKKYSEILALNLDDVQDRKKLCEYSREDLSRYYAQATQEGQEFVSLQEKAKKIESCAKEYEKWLVELSKKEKGQGPDTLDDNLIRETQTQLKKLEPKRQELITSVEKLKNVGPRIYALGVRHYTFCKSNR